MNAGLQVFLSFTLTFGIPLAWAIREWWVLRRPEGGAWPGDGPRPVSPRPRPPETPKRLPECLVPKLPPLPAQPRALEPAHR